MFLPSGFTDGVHVRTGGVVSRQIFATVTVTVAGGVPSCADTAIESVPRLESAFGTEYVKLT